MGIGIPFEIMSADTIINVINIIQMDWNLNSLWTPVHLEFVDGSDNQGYDLDGIGIGFGPV